MQVVNGMARRGKSLMTQLSYPSPTEIQLRLGPHENEILTVVRRCAWWTRAEVEGRVPGSSEVSAGILTAGRTMEPRLREILHPSFQLVFPAGGGEGEKEVRRQQAGSRRRNLA